MDRTGHVQIAVEFAAAESILGLPVDISHVTRRYSVGAPVAVTRKLYDSLLRSLGEGDDPERRLWDLGFAVGAAVKALRGPKTSFEFFTVENGAWKRIALFLTYYVVGTSSFFTVQENA
jgi:hypothetical protein